MTLKDRLAPLMDHSLIPGWALEQAWQDLPADLTLGQAARRLRANGAAKEALEGVRAKDTESLSGEDLEVLREGVEALERKAQLLEEASRRLRHQRPLGSLLDE